jgi:hypothetical protein
MMNDQSVVAADAVLKDYATRGVFQDYRVEPRKSGVDFHFGWLYGQPFTLSCEPKQRRLALLDLLPNVEANSLMHKEIKAWLKGRAAEDVPEHRRVDPLRARAAVRLRDGTLSLTLEAESDADYEYCTRKIINLTHEFFLFMNEYWADYMWENFQMNME